MCSTKSTHSHLRQKHKIPRQFNVCVATIVQQRMEQFKNGKNIIAVWMLKWKTKQKECPTFNKMYKKNWIEKKVKPKVDNC